MFPSCIVGPLSPLRSRHPNLIPILLVVSKDSPLKAKGQWASRGISSQRAHLACHIQTTFHHRGRRSLKHLHSPSSNHIPCFRECFIKSNMSDFQLIGKYHLWSSYWSRRVQYPIHPGWVINRMIYYHLNMLGKNTPISLLALECQMSFPNLPTEFWWQSLSDYPIKFNFTHFIHKRIRSGWFLGILHRSWEIYCVCTNIILCSLQFNRSCLIL